MNWMPKALKSKLKTTLIARASRKAGYDGVEIIGSAGYLISTFLVEKTNMRTDDMAGHMKTVCGLRLKSCAVVAPQSRDFIIIFRIAGMDMLQAA